MRKGMLAAKTSANKTKSIIFLCIIIFSLLFHIIGCFYLYDFENDEGGWLINAKNKVLFNIFSLEGVYYTGLSPLNTFLHTFLFKIFNPSILISRYVSIFFSIATLALFFLFVNKHYTFEIAALAVCIIAVNAVYNRITTFAYLESKVYFFEILTLFFSFSDKQYLRRLSFLPFSFGLSFKPNLIYFAFPLLYSFTIDFENKSNRYLEIFHKNIKNIALFVVGTSFITGIFFYISYIFDPYHFFVWVFKSHGDRFKVQEIFKEPLRYGLLPIFKYFFIRAPLTSLCFLWGLISVIREKRKTFLDIFLLVWIFSSICFYVFQPYSAVRYILDLIFPFSILFAKSMSASTPDINLNHALKHRFPILIIILIAIIQITGSLYFFLVVKPERPAIEVSRWLINENFRYETILAPQQVTIGLPRKSFVTSNRFDILEILSSCEIKYPLLCIIQKDFAVKFKRDDVYLKINGKLIKKIGNFWIYEITRNN